MKLVSTVISASGSTISPEANYTISITLTDTVYPFISDQKLFEECLVMLFELQRNAEKGKEIEFDKIK